jgi:hypothetical protein
MHVDRDGPDIAGVTEAPPSGAAPRYSIGQHVWRRRYSPLVYGKAVVYLVDVTRFGIEYAISFSADRRDLRWYAEEELAP